MTSIQSSDAEHAHGRPIPDKLLTVKEGLNESLLTARLVNDLAEVPRLETELAEIDSADAPHVLARHIAAAQRALTSLKRPQQRLARLLKQPDLRAERRLRRSRENMARQMLARASGRARRREAATDCELW